MPPSQSSLLQQYTSRTRGIIIRLSLLASLLIAGAFPHAVVAHRTSRSGRDAISGPGRLETSMLPDGFWAGSFTPKDIEYFSGGDAPLVITAEYMLEEGGDGSQEIGIRGQMAFGSSKESPTLWSNWIDVEDLGSMDDLSRKRLVMAVIQPGQMNIGSADTYLFRFSMQGDSDWVYANTYGSIGSHPGPQPLEYAGTIAVRSSVDFSPPNQPVVNCRATTTTRNRVTWGLVDDPGGLLGYDIFRTGPSGAAPRLLRRVLPGTTSFDDGSPVGGTSYTYFVRAVDKNFNYSTPSPDCPVTTADRPIQVTIQVSVPLLSPGKVYLNRLVSTDHLPGGTDWMAQSMECSEQNSLCSTLVILQQGAVISFRVSRGSEQTVQTCADGNTPAGENIFTVRGDELREQVIHFSVQNWQDPLVSAYQLPHRPGLTDDTPLILYWNQGMLPPSLNPVADPVDFQVVELDGAGSPRQQVHGTLSYQPLNRSSIFIPNTPWQAGAAYRVTVWNQADLAGNRQQVSFTATFLIDRYQQFLPYLARQEPGLTSE